MSSECGFTCLACGQFRPGSEGAHSEATCLRVQLAAANERAGRMERALNWYADRHNWVAVGGFSIQDADIAGDGGRRARKALEVPDA